MMFTSATKGSNMRKAIIKNTPGAGLESRVEALLPSNYWLEDQEEDGNLVVLGVDVAGWTMEAYVLPRLASGMVFAVEVESDVEAFNPQEYLSVQEQDELDNLFGEDAELYEDRGRTFIISFEDSDANEVFELRRNKNTRRIQVLDGSRFNWDVYHQAQWEAADANIGKGLES